MKTLLLNPPSDFFGKYVSREQCGIGLVEERFLPSEMLLAAAYLKKKDLDVDVLDLSDGHVDFSIYGVVVVWVCVLHTFHRDISWLQRAKESGCRTVIVLNEPYGDFEAETLKRHEFIDAAVRLWERELSLEALLRSWIKDRQPDYPGLIYREGGALKDTGLHEPLKDLTHLPDSSELLRRQPLFKYDAVGITPGRGCTAGCRFCMYANTVQRKRRIEHVVGEVETVSKHVKRVFILDPNLPATVQWTRAFCEELIRKKMPVSWRTDLRPEDADPDLLKLFADSGCKQVMAAVETLDAQIFEKVGAGLTPGKLSGALRIIRNAGIKPIVFFYIGLPWDTPQSLEKIKRFLSAEPIASFYLKQVRPWPGTPVHQAFVSMGLLNKKLLPEDFVDSDTPLCPSQQLSINELEIWKRKIGRAGILQPGYLWRFIRERRIRFSHVRQFVSLLLGRNIFTNSTGRSKESDLKSRTYGCCI
jgi:hypothetical protein